jgi:hypothetical protein
MRVAEQAGALHQGQVDRDPGRNGFGRCYSGQIMFREDGSIRKFVGI